MPKKSQHDTIAAIDLGSNSFHLMVVRPHHDQLHVVDHLRERVQLNAGLDRHMRLQAAAQKRALACLARFRQRLKGIPPASVRAVGTQTLRRATNAAAFLAAAQRVLGYPIEVIAGREEARLIYLGVSHTVADDNRRRLVVDIGGGSTELIVGEHFTPLQMESLEMGCVSMSRRFFPDGAIRAKAMRLAELTARLELEPVHGTFRQVGWLTATGSSGTVRAIAAVVRGAGWCEDGISAEALAQLHDVMVQAGHIDRVGLQGLTPDRRPVFAGGVAILRAVFAALDIEHMEVADGALREGIVYDLMGRIGHRDMRELTIDVLSTRFQVDINQATRVARTAAKCLAQVAKAWQLGNGAGDNAARLLSWAARLHEIGLAIAHTQYHKHGAYLVENSDMPGFSRQEQTAIAALIRGHRRKFPQAAFAQLPRSQQDQAVRLCILLRLAVLLHRSRVDVRLPSFALLAKTSALQLRMPKGWLARHPLTQADLQQEAEFLLDVGFKLTVRNG